MAAFSVRSGTSSARGSDRKSTRLNSSHSQISYAVFCLKKKNDHAGDCEVEHRQRDQEEGVVVQELHRDNAMYVDLRVERDNGGDDGEGLGAGGRRHDTT